MEIETHQKHKEVWHTVPIIPTKTIQVPPYSTAKFECADCNIYNYVSFTAHIFALGRISGHLCFEISK